MTMINGVNEAVGRGKESFGRSDIFGDDVGKWHGWHNFGSKLAQSDLWSAIRLGCWIRSAGVLLRCFLAQSIPPPAGGRPLPGWPCAEAERPRTAFWKWRNEREADLIGHGKSENKKMIGQDIGQWPDRNTWTHKHNFKLLKLVLAMRFMISTYYFAFRWSVIIPEWFPWAI